MNLVTFALLALSMVGPSSHAAAWVEPIYNDVERGAYDLLRLVGRESNGHLSPPVVILTGGAECDPLTTLLAKLTGTYPDVMNFQFSNNDGVFNMKFTEFLKANPRSGTVILRGKPSMLSLGELITKRYYQDADLIRYAFVYQAAPTDKLGNGLTIEKLIRHGYGGSAKGCQYHVVPGMIVRAHLRLAAACETLVAGAAKP